MNFLYNTQQFCLTKILGDYTDTKLCHWKQDKDEHKGTCKDDRHIDKHRRKLGLNWHDRSTIFHIIIFVITAGACIINSTFTEIKYLKVTWGEKLETVPGSDTTASVALCFKTLQANFMRCETYELWKSKHQKVWKYSHTEPKPRKNLHFSKYSQFSFLHV